MHAKCMHNIIFELSDLVYYVDHFFQKYWLQRESNCWPLLYNASALTTELLGHAIDSFKYLIYTHILVIIVCKN